MLQNHVSPMKLKKVVNKNHETFWDLPNLKPFGGKVANFHSSGTDLFFRMYVYLSIQGQKKIFYTNANNITPTIKQTAYAQRTCTSRRKVMPIEES